MTRQFKHVALVCAFAAAAGQAAAQDAASAAVEPHRAAGALERETSVRDLLGTAVHTADGGEVGEVHDLVVADGELVAAVLALGGFAGVGEKRVSVPYHELAERDGTLVVARSEAELDALPPVEGSADVARSGGEASTPLASPEPVAPLETDEALAEIDPRLATGVAANEEAYDEEIDPEIHDVDDGGGRDHPAGAGER